MQLWTSLSSTIKSFKQVLRDRTEALKSNFSGTSLYNQGITTGMLGYNTSNSKLYLRHSDTYVPLNSVGEDKIHYENLVIRTGESSGANPDTKIYLSADFISCRGHTTTNWSTTIDTANTGANGIDTGSLATNISYGVYIIVDVGNSEPKGAAPTFDGIISKIDTPLSLPASYTKSVRVGFARTQTNANPAKFRKFIQTGNVFYYTDIDPDTTASDNTTQLLIAGSNATTFTSVGSAVIRNLTPYDNTKTKHFAKEILIGAKLSGTTPKLYLTTDTNTTNGIRVLSDANPETAIWRMPINGTDCLRYRVDVSTNSVHMYLIGYVDII